MSLYILMMKKIKGIEKIKQRIDDKLLSLNSKKITFEVAELFFQHNSTHGFTRYDMIVRLLAIENYFGKNDYGFSFYRRMQIARIGQQKVEKAVERFLTLIKSYEKNGYDKNSKIILDKNLHLVDGSHRMAMAMFYHIPSITALVRPKEYYVFYGIEWFRINGFTYDECKILVDKYEALKKCYATPFICTLWSPVAQYYDEITEKLQMFGEITEVHDFNYSDEDYAFYTRGIYHVDDIEKWKIEKKIEYMRASSPTCHSIRMVAIKLENPQFRLKTKTGKSLSKQCELIKKLIRDAYKKKVDQYFHDVVIHIGDNFYQNHAIYKLLKMPSIDLKKILLDIHDCQYVITKIDVPYMPLEFPDKYPLGKDIDIVCANIEEYKKVVGIIQANAEIYESAYKIRVVKKMDDGGEEYRTLVRFEQEGQFLVFQFDVSSKCFPDNRSASNFAEEMVVSRQSNGIYYMPSVNYEMVLRLQEYYQHPAKVHHLEYVKQHMKVLDEGLCEKYLNFNWRKIIFE